MESAEFSCKIGRGKYEKKNPFLNVNILIVFFFPRDTTALAPVIKNTNHAKAKSVLWRSLLQKTDNQLAEPPSHQDIRRGVCRKSSRCAVRLEAVEEGWGSAGTQL